MPDGAAMEGKSARKPPFRLPPAALETGRLAKAEALGALMLKEQPLREGRLEPIQISAPKRQ